MNQIDLYRTQLARLNAALANIPQRLHPPIVRVYEIEGHPFFEQVDKVKGALQAVLTDLQLAGKVTRLKHHGPYDATDFRVAMESIVEGYLGKAHVAVTLVEMDYLVVPDPNMAKGCENYFGTDFPLKQVIRTINRVTGKDSYSRRGWSSRRPRKINYVSPLETTGTYAHLKGMFDSGRGRKGVL